MTAVIESGIDWAVREAATELALGTEVLSKRLVRLVEADASRPCVSGDPEDWFPVHETPERAQSLCSGCQVLELCRELSMRRPEHGIWGGLTTAERLNARRRQLRAAQATSVAPAADDQAADDGAAA